MVRANGKSSQPDPERLSATNTSSTAIIIPQAATQHFFIRLTLILDKFIASSHKPDILQSFSA